MKEDLKNQDFKSEAEEAQWWEERQDSLGAAFEQAAAAGTLGRGTAARGGSTPTTTIRLDPSDVAKARAQAERRGLKYQTYLKMLIHEALFQADTQSSSARSHR
jgi:predicted DNA binding CopG/RHH family protein